MRIAAAALAALAAAALAGCGAEPAKESPKAAPAPAGAPAAAAYPLPTCVISGDKLGEMGPPVVFTYEGTEVRLCCPKCRPIFDKDPKKFIAMIEAARKK